MPTSNNTTTSAGISSPLTIVHEYSGSTCTIKLATMVPVKGYVTEHLPVGVEIVNHDGILEIGIEEIEPGTIPHRFIFEGVTDLTVTYTTNQPIKTPNYYWVAGWPGNPMMGYEDENIKFSTN